MYAWEEDNYQVHFITPLAPVLVTTSCMTPVSVRTTDLSAILPVCWNSKEKTNIDRRKKKKVIKQQAFFSFLRIAQCSIVIRPSFLVRKIIRRIRQDVYVSLRIAYGKGCHGIHVWTSERDSRSWWPHDGNNCGLTGYGQLDRNRSALSSRGFHAGTDAISLNSSGKAFW